MVGGGGKVGIMMIGGSSVGITGGVTTTVCGTTTVSTIGVQVGDCGVAVAVAVRVAVSEGTSVAISVTVSVAVAVLVTVGDGVIVAVAVGISVDVAVEVLVRVATAVGCGVTSWAGAAPGPMLTMSTIPMSTGRSMYWGKWTIRKRKGHTTCKPASETDLTVASGGLDALSSL